MDAQKKEEVVERKVATTANHMTESIQGSIEMIEHLKSKLSESDFVLIGMELRNQYLAGYLRRQEEQRAAQAAFQKELEEGIRILSESLKEKQEA